MKLPLCDKCDEPVRPHNNLYYFALATGEAHGVGVLLCASRHLLPEGDCEGSPSRAQYLEGRPRDTRGWPYDPAQEDRFRAAYRLVQATPQNVLAEGSLSDWLPRKAAESHPIAQGGQP